MVVAVLVVVRGVVQGWCSGSGGKRGVVEGWRKGGVER